MARQGDQDTPSYALDTINDSVYPNFLSGSSYLMSKAIAYTLYKMALIVPIFHLEDVYITGVLPATYNHLVEDNDEMTLSSLFKDQASLLNGIEIHPENDNRFDQSIIDSDSCSLSSIISTKELNSHEMQNIHMEMKRLRNANDEYNRTVCDLSLIHI